MGLLTDFRKFALRGSLIDMAVGFTVGAAFTTIAKSFVDDIIMPPLGMLIGKVDFKELKLPLNSPAAGTDPVTINYGNFINNLIAFLLIAFVMFLLIRAMNKLEATLEAQFGTPPAPGEPTDKKCPHCLTTIPYQATRCAACTSDLTNG